jgi:hypothetical protein
MNAPIAEIVMDSDVVFRVIKENWSNNKTPTHPALLERYDGSEWIEVDRWDRQDNTDDSNTVVENSDETIVDNAVERINNKKVFESDGNVKSVNSR